MRRLRATFVIATGAATGLGHLKRSSVLAQALIDADAEVAFRLTDMAFAGLLPAGEAHAFDPQEAYPSDLVVADGYDLPFADLRAQARRAFAVIDDLADRPFEADAVINHNLYGTQLAYPNIALTLLGPSFALIEPRFARLAASPAGSDGRIVVTLGGSSLAVAAIDLAAALAAALDREVEACLPKAIDTAVPGGVKLRTGEALADVLGGAALVVCGLGVTYLEALAARRRVIGIRLVANQALAFSAAQQSGLPVLASLDPRETVSLAATLLAADARVVAGLDGLGARRAADIFLRYASG